MRLRRFFACLCFLCVCSLWGESTGIEGLFRYKLENGLELYVVENDSAPLVTIEIAVRTGAFAQTPENAGLFHLYEHMMFKGNSRYANERETTEAMNALGVGEWNGTTGIDRVNYYFTIPSSLLRQGLEFWSYAVRTPLMDEKELENEKKVVLSEIRGNFTTPSRIANAALTKTLYPQMPYKLDPSGRAENVENCTVETLKKIQAEYYVPDNSAVFVGGDVDYEQVFELVKEIYGDWKPSASGIKSPSSHSKAPLKNTKKLVYPDPRVASVMTYASLYLRGPDGEWDRTDTYAADVWNTLINNPSGAYASALLSEKELNIKDSDYTGGYYSTQRLSGLISLSCVMLNAESSPVRMSEKFLDVINKKCLPLFTGTAKGFTDNMKLVLRQLEDSRIYSLETAEGLLSSLSSCWASCDGDYFADYQQNIEKVKAEDVNSFAKKYIEGKKGVLFISVNPEVYRKYKKEFDSAGYQEVTADNAFWWNDGK